MKKLLFVTALLAFATSVSAQVDHLQCHKVKDAQKFKAAVVALTAIQGEFQMPEDCTIKGKAAEFCVPVDKTVVDLGEAPGAAAGPGQDLSLNDYVCYKMKCPKRTIADTAVTDQFGARDLLKIKTAQKLCVPAVKGLPPTTTTTSTTVPDVPMCPEGGEPDACLAVQDAGSCEACCVNNNNCKGACDVAIIFGGTECTDGPANASCAMWMNAAGCADVCCP